MKPMVVSHMVTTKLSYIVFRDTLRLPASKTPSYTTSVGLWFDALCVMLPLRPVFDGASVDRMI
ncbi:hypothetical protein DPMN_119726 [Dreissena polymorpha]|uniref:Uncharacterized protein n=1 Tax=Dreissena polymorpha TaxID=45954 RepID=A0A9D4GMW2_DREPO|nr:hypothetical protein DPMN_119726 [Dreissena polymorpha]